MIFLFKKTLYRLALVAVCFVLATPAWAQSSFVDPSLSFGAQRNAANIARLSDSGFSAQQQDTSPAEDKSNDACADIPFGQSLFGAPKKSGGQIMSSKQRVAVGDRIAIASWGAVNEAEVAVVDSQGFIFIKGVGPVHVAGVTEDNLSNHIQNKVSRVFSEDVNIYARLEQNAGTPVLVAGNVGAPGQYYGSAQDSIVSFLNRAGGILTGQGSYRHIQIRRNDEIIDTVDLYDFLEQGRLKGTIWEPGDVIVVGAPQLQVSVNGAVRRCHRFELLSGSATAAEALGLADPLPSATHAMIKGYRDNKPYRNVLSLESLYISSLQDGDSVFLYAAPRSDNITIKIEGPSKGHQMLAVPLHTKLSHVLDHIPVDAKISNIQSIHLRRQSVAKSQKEALDESLNRLLQSALTAPAQSDGEAAIRAQEAHLIETFVNRVKNIEPDGRVVVMQEGVLQDLPMEDGDVVVIPEKTGIVSIEGEVILPRAVVVQKGKTAKDYIMMAGGFTERALKREFIVIRPNGNAVRAADPEIKPGDRLLILPKVDTKSVQTAKDLIQILYQVALGAGVLVNLND